VGRRLSDGDFAVVFLGTFLASNLSFMVSVAVKFGKQVVAFGALEKLLPARIVNDWDSHNTVIARIVPK
jgi:hypothetical protein